MTSISVQNVSTIKTAMIHADDGHHWMVFALYDKAGDKLATLDLMLDGVLAHNYREAGTIDMAPAYLCRCGYSGQEHEVSQMIGYTIEYVCPKCGHQLAAPRDIS